MSRTGSRVPNGAFVAIEGPTGVGKTTLAARLAHALDATTMLDPFEDNPFLPAFLTAGSTAASADALRVELTFLALRVAQLRGIDEALAGGRNVVADWALLKQVIFAATTLNATDTHRMAETVNVWALSLPVPDLLIGLSASTGVLCSRVRRRARGMESGITGDELAALSRAFEAAYDRWPGALLRVDADTFDVFDNCHVSELAATVRQLTSVH